ncbi:MAG: hypothetical protein JNK15_23810 [Planctomycetes bacterium]|nr:hypothetical protein [Planctomycetota bacterium]
MKRIALLSFAVATATGLCAQSNVVPGLDGRLSLIDDLYYWGRRGPAYPNGEVGVSMLNEMCNPGTVNIPWQVAMSSNHPKFGFLLVRVSGGKLEQVNDWSYCKHAFTSTNYDGPCGTCIQPGTGQLMGVHCADTYGSGNNGDRYWLGPPSEINPWLGTWAVVGSYFDRGDPQVAGAAATDGNRSLNNTMIAAFDDVKNRMTVREQDLITPGAAYYYGIHLIHEGEAVANRGDNLASRGTTPNWNGSSWSFPNNGAGMTHGSILSRWPGADVNAGQNGNDDGRFFVASVVTALGGGQYHYEYAVYNCDNNRGGATFRLPIDASATASNFTFGDIDQNPLNDWTSARVGNEIVFTAPVSNPLNWNTIYNFGFDANFAPGSSGASIDEARVGPGGLTVTVQAKAPAGSTFAQWTAVGTGCGGSPGCYSSFYEQNFDLANSGFTMTPTANGYNVSALAGSWIAPAGATVGLGDDAGTVRTLPFTFPFAGGTTTNLWVCSNGFVSVGSTGSTTYTPSTTEFLTLNSTWAALWRDLDPSAGGTIRFDANASRAVLTFDAVPNYGGGGNNTFQWQFYPSGVVHVLYQAVAGAGTTLVGYTRGGGAADPGAIDISAALPAGFALCHPVQPAVPTVALVSSARPVVGTTINLNTSNIPAGTVLGIQMMSTNLQVPPVDLTFLGMPGCFLYQALDVLFSFPTPGSTGSFAWPVPNVPAAAGLVVRTQSATLTPGINAFGFANSNAVDLLIGVL